MPQNGSCHTALEAKTDAAGAAPAFGVADGATLTHVGLIDAVVRAACNGGRQCVR